MSSGFYLNENNYPIYAGTVTLKGLDAGGNDIAPINVNNTVLCSNLHAEFADNCLNPVSTANVALALKTLSGAVYVDTSPAPSNGMVLKAVTSTIGGWGYITNVSHANWADTANSINSPTTGNSFIILNDPQNNYVLTGVTANTAQWAVASGGSGNITSNVLTILNDPQANYVLTGVTANTAEWTVAAPTSGNITSNVLTILNDPQANYVLTGVTANTAQWEIAAPTSGNITSNVLTILNDPQANYVLTGVTANTAQWAAAAPSGGGNITANMITGDSQATAGSTTVLSATSNVVQVFSGSSNETCQLPATSQLGLMFMIVNRSTGNLTVANIGGAQIDYYNTTGSGTYIAISTANVSSSWIKISSGS